MLKYIGDFERLKEFGFTKHYHSYIKNCVQEDFKTIRIEVDAREVSKKFGGFRYIYGIYYYSNEPMLETLIELVKAGLVEKVVEE